MPNVIDYPAASTNYGGYGRFNTPRAIVLHTPEEKPDEYESTPVWFANPAAQASTQIYISDNGDIYRMVPDEQPAWACGTNSVNRHWKGNYGGYAPWGEPGLSNNVLTLNIEIEGYAASLVVTEPQYQSMLWQCREWVTKYNIPIDSDHICGHGDLSTDRTDPGAGLPWERLFADLGAPITAPPPATVPANEAGWVQVSQAELVEVLNNAAAGSLGAAIAGSGGVTYLVRKTPSGDKWDFVIHNIPLTAAPDLEALK
jgi:N-acetyl-anhydromuramyl-L-alanine amidase AmpD